MIQSIRYIGLIVVLLVYYCSSLQFYLSPGEFRCVGQELDQEDLAVFTTGATAKDLKKSEFSQKLSMLIKDPNEEVLVDERIIIGNRPKEFQQTIKERGVYIMCFELEEGNTPVRIFFHIDYKSRAAQALDISKTTSKDELTALEIQLKADETLLSEISKEIDFATRQEILLREAGDATKTRIHRFGLLSISILVFTSLWQIVYLRRFFTSKKLL